MTSRRALDRELMSGAAVRAIKLPQPTFTANLFLGERLVRETARIKGAPEHAQIVRLMARAEAYRLSDETVRDLSRTLRDRTLSIERSIDMIRPPAEVTWIEYSNKARRLPGDPGPLPGSALPGDVGILIARDEHEPDRYVVVTAWDLPDGSVRHSYAVASISLSDLSHLAWYARNRHSSDPGESVARMLSSAVVTIPPGLKTEMEVVEELEDPDGWQDAYDLRAKAAILDVASELPFLYAALIAMNSGQIQIDDRVKGRPATIGHRFAKQRKLPFLPKPTGFVRIGRKDAPQVQWHAP